MVQVVGMQEKICNGIECVASRLLRRVGVVGREGEREREKTGGSASPL